MAEVTPKIALLSTGDEIINGDVCNTNSQTLAQRLRDCDLQPGLHLTASDDQTEIQAAMRFLLDNHQGLIITGGLGPTSDDRTRFALSQVLNTPLVFHSACWQRIVERLQRLSLPIPDTNRQQCLFPSAAVIFPNDNGTAAACQVMHGQQAIFMLPGPPFECLPIFEDNVLPYFQAHGYVRPLFRCEWLLLGVSEGSIAAQLDPLMTGSDCYVGYRINQPYLEVKLQSASQVALAKMRAQFDVLIGAQSVSSRKEKSSMQLKQFIIAQQCHLTINDQATGGWLATTLLSPATAPYLSFVEHVSQPDAFQITLSGLAPYWHNQQGPNLLQLEIQHHQQTHQVILPIPLRKERTLLYALEMACREIVAWLSAVRV